MAGRSFVHLHCHSHYSLLDGASRIPELVAQTKALGMNAVALTDHGNLYGAIEFYRECKAAGINPVIGYEAYVAPGKRTDRDARGRGDAGFHLTLLARNETGFRNLIKMSSVAFLEGYYYVPRIDKELLADHRDGLICLSGCASSEFSEFILKGQLDEAARVAEWFAELFGSHFYVEIQNNGLDIQRQCAEGAIEIANRKGWPLVATCDAHYLCQKDAFAHEVLLAINTGKKLSDERRMSYGSDQFYVQGPEEMYRRFAAHADAVARSQQIADGVDIQLDFKKRHFPVFTPPGKKTPEQYLREIAHAGLVERYGEAPPKAAVDRLEHELGIICRMGFAGYFLIVWDFVHWAQSQGIPCNARGSGCGAITCYVLRISNVCPLEYDLLFERFLDPNRSEAPDIDIDFCQVRREKVIAYVKQKYGEQSVAQIATFGTMAAKAALKDVGRVLDIPLERVNLMTGLVPPRLGATLDDALREVGEFRKEYEADPQTRKWVDTARQLEGTNRQSGIHAAGVVIADGPITNYVPVHRAVRKGDDGSLSRAQAKSDPVVATQWVMGDLEKVGMLKMDFLGLRTLTLLDNTVQLIKKTRGRTIDVETLPLDDAETYKMLSRGDAKGVFQFESDGIRELLKRLKPDNIRDIIACTALYRPGPLESGMVDDYVECKHGRRTPVYPHPIMEEITRETHSVLVFQEQVMRTLNRMGNIELASAYACIKAISKKKQEIIDARKVDFVKGSQANGLTKEKAEEIFELIVKFGGYGFNKCVIGSTVVSEALTGERTTVESLFRNRRPFHVHALGEDGRLRPRPVSDVVWNGRKPVFRLRTELGNEIVATANHPFRTLDGWTTLADLRPGDRVAAPRGCPVATTRSWPRHELIVLAGLLAEGNVCHPSCLYYYNNDRVIVDEFAESARQFPDTAARIDTRRNGIHEVCVNTGGDFRFKKGHVPWHAAARDAAPVDDRPTRSGAYRWADDLGILGRSATQKAVPAPVFELCDADLELFLGRLWAGDGFIANATLAVPYYATSSVQLAKDVQFLLLRLGMVSRVTRKEFKYRDGMRPGYTVHVLGTESVDTFARRVLPHCLGRDVGAAHLTRHLASTERGMTSKDTIPVGVRTWVNAARQLSGLTWTEVEEQSGVCVKELIGQGSPQKRGFRRSTVAQLGTFFHCDRLQTVAAADVFWDRVVSIEPEGEQDTYDLTVDIDHNFVADGLIVHNSHSAAYAVISYQTAYLKRHYTPEFMAALLSSEVDDGNKRDILVEHIADARKFGVDVLPPDVNTGEADFTVHAGKVVFGLTAIKGVGRGAAEEIVRARVENGKFRDIFDFCERVDLRVVNRSAVERMIKAGAFDVFGRRAALTHVLPRAIAAADEKQQDRKRGQKSFFDLLDDGGAGGGSSSSAAEVLPDVPEWPEAEKLKYEKEVLDFYLSSHPLAEFDADLRRFTSHTVEAAKKLDDGQEVRLGGMMTLVRFFTSKKSNKRYARCKIEDFTGLAECVMWPSDYDRHADMFADDRIVLAQATIERPPHADEPIFVLNKLLTLEQARQELTTAMLLRLRLAEHEPKHIDALAGVLRRAPGNCPVQLVVVDGAGKKAQLKLSRDFQVDPAKLALDELEMILGRGGVVFTGR